MIISSALALVLSTICFAGSITDFSVGEKSSYAITYFGATAGILDLEVLPPTTENGKERKEFSAVARTDSLFSLVYHLKNVYRSTVDISTGLPLRWVAKLDETRQMGTTIQEFDHSKLKARFIDKRQVKGKGKVEKDVTKEIFPGSQDAISAIYHLRSLPLEKGKFFDLPVFIGEEACRLRVLVESEEDLPTKIGTLPAYVLKPSLFKDGQIREIIDTKVWIAKRPDRALLKIKAKVKVGSIIAYLRSFESGQK